MLGVNTNHTNGNIAFPPTLTPIRYCPHALAFAVTIDRTDWPPKQILPWYAVTVAGSFDFLSRIPASADIRTTLMLRQEEKGRRG